jgi:hypothetical protein
VVLVLIDDGEELSSSEDEPEQQDTLDMKINGLHIHATGRVAILITIAVAFLTHSNTK